MKRKKPALMDSTVKSYAHLLKDPYLHEYSYWQNIPNPDYIRLLYNSGIIVIGSLISAEALYLMPESVSKWNKEEIKQDLFSKWKLNVQSGPVIDHDKWYLNYVSHPYFGAVYYMNARSTGLSGPWSFFYSLVYSSLFWEYGIEAFAEKPSIQDLIITPVTGSILGEFFYLAKRSIILNDYRLLGSPVLGHIATFLMDPLNEIMDLASSRFKERKKVLFQISPTQELAFEGKTVLNLRVSVIF